MQKMMSLLVASVLAIGAQNAIAGGLPETKTTDSTNVDSTDSNATTATATSASATSSDTSASATESSTNTQTAENIATDSADDVDEKIGRAHV